mgnify:CR=1 FL=1
MKDQELKINLSKYNVFAICQDFRQRMVQLNRLKEKVINELADKNVSIKE